MKISQNGIDLIKRFEGCKLDSYMCQAGKWTIGYGHTQGVEKGMKITQQTADNFLILDLKLSENCVNQNVKKPIQQHQFDSLVSFSFNVGNGAFKASTLLKFVNQNPDDIRIATEFRRWVYVNRNVSSPGLINRRKAELCNYFKHLDVCDTL